MNDLHYSDENIKMKIMAFLDGELPISERSQIELKIAEDPQYQKYYHQLQKLKEVTGAMKYKILPDMYWDEYWRQIYNRLERGISWILISLGAIIVLSFALWTAVSDLLADHFINPFLKYGILILIVGMVILFISILREKLMVKKVDKYKEVER
jgi:hypothetical protein